MSTSELAAPEAARTPAPLGRRLAPVERVEELGAYRVVWATDHDGPAEPQPGQFYMLASAERWGGGEDERPYLPRAFSFCRVKQASGGSAGGPLLGFMLEAVGPGTERLGGLPAGEGLLLAGPFGVGFRPVAERRALLVGGGIGTAPVLALADELGARATVLLGFRSSAHAAASALFQHVTDLATDDGSAGRRALVTDLLREQLDDDPDAAVFACGPPPMLEAVRALCALRGVPAQLALESGMACGYGACFGCVVPTRAGYVRLCLEGPVLDGAELESALFEGAGH